MVGRTGAITAAAAGSLSIGGDLTVHRLGFGAMRITGPGIWGEPADREAAKAVLRRAVELGVNFIDTADSYGPQVSERLIAEALHPYPRDLVIATKGGLLRPGPNRWDPDGRPEHLRAACEGSLRRLRLETIPLYQLHAPDGMVPYEESIGTLVALQREGKIRHIGVSNVSTDELARARRLATVVSVQNAYNLGDRSSEDVLAECTRQRIVFIPWYPLATGKLARTQGLVGQIATRHAVAPAQVALAWLLAHAPLTLPIPGTASQAHLEENVAAAGVGLLRDEIQALDGTGG